MRISVKNIVFSLSVVLIFMGFMTEKKSYAAETKDAKTKVYDYIIVGNGTAGAVLAKELSDGNKKDILVLEAGEDVRNDPIILNPDSSKVIDHLNIDPKYSETYSTPLFTPAQYFHLYVGIGWGGSSLHNYLLAIRGTPSCYNLWGEKSGDLSWNYNSLLPLMKAVEHYTPDQTTPNFAQRGNAGPISITQGVPISSDPLVIALSKGTEGGVITDYNDPTLGDIGFSASQTFITPLPNSQRSYAANAFLPPSVVDENGKGVGGRKLTILSNARVDRVLFKDKKAYGIVVIEDDAVEKISEYHGKEIILCAGTIGTPAVLQRSGIGDKALLESLKIKVVVDNPNVGAHVAAHYGTLVTISGTTTVTQPLVGFVDMRPFMPGDGARRFQILRGGIARLAASQGVIFQGRVMNPQSEGNVKIVSRNAGRQPELKFGLFLDGPHTKPGTDAYLTVSFLKLMKQAAEADGRKIIAPAPADYESDEALFAYIKRVGGTLSQYLSSSARMGTSIKDAVVDSKLKVFGVDNLRIVDLSIAPTIPDANPCFSVYVIAMKAAEIIKAGG